VLSFVALVLTVAGFGWLGVTAYHAATDAFVAPSILSPESDLVLTSKLRFSELTVERARALAEKESLDVDLAALEQASGRLEGLRGGAGQAHRWVTEVTAIKASAGAADLEVLAEQKRMLEGMQERQREQTRRARADLEAGLVSQADYAREALALTQVELSLLETGRATLQSRSARHEMQLAERALARRGAGPSMPELLVREEQLVRLELEILRLHSERHSKEAQRRALGERLSKIDELTTQLRSRPVFQATEKSLDVAFVPYTQLEGVEPGARVLSCVWGLFACKDVGSVSELVPGEVVLPDPWGSPARGQYAVLTLSDRASAMSKVLRVRATAEAPSSAGPSLASGR
jgi:hypothetical protein